jgi:PKD repeat protein
VPVPALDQEFDLAILGTKGVWYDHKVSVLDPVAQSDTAEEAQTPAAQWADGTYSVELTFSGGSGKAKILSPATVTVKDGTATATIQWSSENYDYMLVDGEKYLPLSTEGGSVFEIPVQGFDVPLDVVGDTVAMSTPHEIDYTIVFAAQTMTPVE